ncbi:hypothetical protein PTKIN_Ptkin17bG0115100 [Pterospermum kingtungense]
MASSSQPSSSSSWTMTLPKPQLPTGFLLQILTKLSPAAAACSGKSCCIWYQISQVFRPSSIRTLSLRYDHDSRYQWKKEKERMMMKTCTTNKRRKMNKRSHCR